MHWPLPAALLALSLSVSILLHSSSMAQDGREITFGPGTFVINGEVSSKGSSTHYIRAVEGQTISVSLASTNDNIHFSVFAPDVNEAVFVGSIEGRDFQKTDARTGDYELRVFSVGGLGSLSEGGDYRLVVEIEEAAVLSENGNDGTFRSNTSEDLVDDRN